ncbi:MAG: HAMP domain-containing sensor histidine kinase [Candidatus Paceibacterota bacterium]
MTYQIILDNNQILTGSVLRAGITIVIFIIIVTAIIIYISKRLTENRRLKYEFITIVAHKFRTPLTYVKWLCDALIPEEMDPFKKKSLEDVKTSNQKLIDLTGTLIEIADSESSGGATYAYENIPLGEFVKGVSSNFKDAFHNKNIFLGIHCDDNEIKVKADKTRLEFIIHTLLENASIYTSTGKNVEVTVSGTSSKAIISIQDNGIGISKQDLPHIFTKFFRGKNAKSTDTEGFGVGLYLASSIIKHLGGKMTAESDGENLGSKFTIVLPRVK